AAEAEEIDQALEGGIEPKAISILDAVVGLPPATFGDRVAHIDDVLPCRRAAEAVVEVVDREDVTDTFVVVFVDRGLDVLFRTRTGELAREQVVDLDTEHDGEFSVADYLPGLGWGANDAEPTLAGTA